MKVTQEKLPASQVGLEIEITPEMSQKVYDRVVQKLARTSNIPGFRKGKVPKQVLIQQVGATRVKAAAVEELVEDSLKEAVKQEKIEVLGNYQLRSSFDELVTQFQPGQALTFSASVDVQPEVTLQPYTGWQLQVEAVEFNPEKVEEVLRAYQDDLATLVPVEGRAAQIKDVVIIDFTGVLPSDDPEQEPEPVPGGQAEDFQLELLEGQFIAGFIDGIVGMNPGDTKEVEAIFPEDYPQPKVAGQRAVFTITLKELKEKELPEVDDDLAQEVSEFQTIADLQAFLEKRFQKESEEKTRSNREQAVVQELLKRVEVDLPETLIEQEVNFLVQQTAMQLQSQGIDIKKFITQEIIARLRERSRPEAIERLTRALALGKIAQQEAIAVSKEELTTKIQELLNELGENSQNIDLERLQTVVADDLLREKVIDWLITQSTIEQVPEGTLSAAAESQAQASEIAASPEELVNAEEPIALETPINVDAEAEPTDETAPEADSLLDEERIDVDVEAEPTDETAPEADSLLDEERNAPDEEPAAIAVTAEVVPDDA